MRGSQGWRGGWPVVRVAACRAVRRAERGAVAPLAAVLLTLLLSLAGLGVDVAYLYDARLAMQSAVDLAALAGAEEAATTRSRVRSRIGV